MAPIRFGFMMPADSLSKAGRKTYVQDVNRALELVTGHFDSAWIIDHLQFGSDDVLESLTTLSYMAALHPDLKFGTAVLSQSFRNPAHLAKMTATLQFLSNGRFMLGMGAGWHKEEYLAYGYDFPQGRIRVAQLEESLQIIKALWTEESVTFEGRYHRTLEAHCEPKPEPLPQIMVGAFGPQMLRLTAKYADWWNISSTGIKGYKKLVQECELACAEMGRDPSTLRRTWCGGCLCVRNHADVQSLAGDRYTTEDDDFSFVGTPQQIIDQMQPFIALGVDYFILDCGGFPNLTTLELLTHEVLPALSGS